MNELIIFQKYSVKVNGGSGCLFQPLDSNYSYVLTAKHVVNDDHKPSIIYSFKEGEDKELAVIEYPYLHTTMDAAIIKVEKIDGIEELLRDDSVDSSMVEYSLCGFPKVRGGSFRRDKLKLNGLREDKYLEGRFDLSAVKEEVSGQSGGGIIRMDENTLLFAGVQKGMAAPDNDEALGAIKIVPISCFDEIVAENEENLTPLFPPYIGNLSNLINKIFSLDNLTVKTDLIKSSLQEIASSLCMDFCPLKILELYEEELLVHGTEKSMKYHEQLWLAFLELLAINQLHSDSKLKFDQIKDIHKKNKLYFTDSYPWTKKIGEIYNSDLSEIEKGGAVVIAACKDKAPSKVELHKNVLLDISAVPQSKMNISSTIKDISKDIRIIHIHKFQQYIMANEHEFYKVNSTNVEETLKDKTDGVI